MAIETPKRPGRRAPPGSPAPLFGIFLILWIAFAVCLVSNQGALDSAWHWLLGLPLVLQIVMWVLFLPLAVSLWIWESDWSLGVRLTLIIVIGLCNLIAFGPKPGTAGRSDKIRSDLNQPHGSTPV